MIQVRLIPQTTGGSLNDFLVKDDAAGVPGSTKIITVGDFISTYFVSTISTQSGVVATAGGQTGAAQLTRWASRVDSVAASGYGVKLLAAIKNRQQEVLNNDPAGNDMQVYPYPGDNFYGLGTDVPMTLSAGSKLAVLCFDTLEWTIN